MTTKCPKCGTENRAGGRFCRSCGAALAADDGLAQHCPACGAHVRDGAHFCPKCGGSIPAGTSVAVVPPTPGLPSSPAVSIQPRIGARPGGQLAVGNYNLLVQMGDVRDAVVNIFVPTAQPHPRAAPANLRPRPIAHFLDRQVEVAAATSALLSANTVAVHGECGIGKTTLLCYLAHHPVANAFRDGVITLYAANHSADDIAAFLYDALFTCDVPFHPTPAQLREGLQNRRALVLLDDVRLSRESLETLLNLAPNCTFVITSEKRCYWGAGQTMELPGLPPTDAIALLERELGRALAPAERTAGQRLAIAMNGHPLRLLQLAALAQSSQRSLNAMLPLVQVPAPDENSAVATLAALSELERRVLAALAAVRTPLHVEPLALIVDHADLQPTLKVLQQRGFVQRHSPRYSLTGDLATQLDRLWDLEPWRNRALEVLTAWAEGQQTTPEALQAESDAILSSVEQALASGKPREALRLIRASEGVVALSARWGAWSALLNHAREAARALQDRPAEAWALHQLGTRAGCLGQKEAALHLTEALNLRQQLGDAAGAARTRHNMTVFLGMPPADEAPKQKPAEKAPPKPEKPPVPTPRPRPGLARLGWIAAAIMGIAIVAIGGWQAIANRINTRTPIAQPMLTPRLWLEEGCGHQYSIGDASTLYLESNLDGWGYVSRDGTTFAVRNLRADVPERLSVSFADIPPGTHRFEATVMDAQESQKRTAQCAFTVLPNEIIQPDETAAPQDNAAPPTPRLFTPKDQERRYCPIGTQSSVIEFTWSAVNDPSGIAYYELALEALEYSPRTYPLARSDGPNFEEDLPCPEIYRWRVRAWDGAGNASAWSEQWEFSLRQEEDVAPPPTPSPLEPGDVNPEYAESVICPITLLWTAVSDPSGVFYSVEVEAIYESDSPQVLAESNLTDTQLTLDEAGCDPYTTHRWRVATRDGAGNQSGEWSPWMYYTVLP